MSENPFGISEKVREALQKESEKIMYYPSSDYMELKQKLARRLQLPVECLYIGNGLDEVILALSLALDLQNKKVLIPENTFMGYYFSAVIVKGNIKQLPLKDYSTDIDLMISEANESVGAIFICNPHNPFGTIISKDEIRRLLTVCEAHGIYLIVDEAYIEYLENIYEFDVVNWISSSKYLIVLRTFSKAYGLAGLRCGYACADNEVIKYLLKIEAALPFRTNRFAEAAALAALSDEQHLKMVREKNKRNKEWLEDKLEQKKLKFISSYTNFVTIFVENSISVTNTLLERYNIRVKDLASMGLNGWIRISIGTEEQLDKLWGALIEII